MSQEKTKENWLIRVLRGLFEKPILSAMQPEQCNPFLERTIEHWLGSVNELGYQLPFCQILLSEGYTVLHNSKQNAFEQGKDIIAIASDGIPCGFQLKGNNITNKKWRNEVKGEIEALRDLTIVHPEVDKNKPHRSFLVTNGELEDTVRVEIENLNNGKWKDNPLQVITYGDLLGKFVKISSGFVPQKIEDYKVFLDLYFSDGRELIDEERFTHFICDVLRLDADKISMEERERSIAAAVLFTGYVISNFKKQNNQVSVLKTLSLLSSYIFAVVEKNDLPDKYWIDSFRIVWAEMMLTGERLKEEIDRDGLQNLVSSIFDGELGVYRKYLAASHLLAYKVSQLIEGRPGWDNIINDTFFLKLKDSLKVWGESALFPLILLFLITNKAAEQGKVLGNDAFKPLCVSLEMLIQFNGRRSKTGMISPYYNIETILKRRFGLLEESIDESFSMRSFMVSSLIDIMARHDRRKELERYWREITYIAQESFYPKETWQHFLWRCNKGQNKSVYPKQTQGWAELKKEAAKIDLKQIPKILQKHSYFLPFFLLVYPHRATNNYSKFLDEIVNKSK